MKTMNGHHNGTIIPIKNTRRYVRQSASLAGIEEADSPDGPWHKVWPLPQLNIPRQSASAQRLHTTRHQRQMVPAPQDLRWQFALGFGIGVLIGLIPLWW